MVQVLTTLGLLSVTAIPFGLPLIIGAGIGGLNATMMRRQVRQARGQQSARTAVNEAIGTWAVRTRTAISQETPRLRREAYNALSDVVQQRVDDLNAQLATIAADADAAKKSETRRVELETDRDTIRQLRTSACDLSELALAGGVVQ